MDMNLEHLRSWIGREDSASEVLSETLVRQFNATFDRNSEPQQVTGEGAVAPLLIHLCLAQPAVSTSGLGPDGHAERGSFLPPVPLPRRMWAGGEFSFHGDIQIGDLVTRVSKVTDVVLKSGRTGQLCFVTVEHQVTAGDRHVLSERQDIVYREAPAQEVKPVTKSTSPEKAPDGEHVRRITPSAPYLFRYSAMTFNSHRIHYDKDYVRTVENYPGLIVHGPLQATLLCQHAADLKGKKPTRFRFRSLSPLFDTADFTVNGSVVEDGMKLWTARIGGPIAMEATAQW